MPATNYTPIQLYRSTTSGNEPSAANLSAGEIALNIADNDMTMYFENASGTVKRFFNNPAALKYPTADGTSGQVMQTDGAGVLSFAAAPSTALTNNTRQAVTSSATTTINLNSGNVVDLTMAANITTLSFTNVPASGTPILVQIVVKNASDGTAYTITWPSSVYWSGQYSQISLNGAITAPTLATGPNGITVIALLTTDGGTKWRGWVEANIPGGTGQSMYSWGLNSVGQLGQNNTNNLSSPVQVGSLTTWSVTSCGRDHALAVKTDGTLWVWGSNGSGQLGLNFVSGYRSSPVQVGTATDWSAVSGGYFCSFAIKTGGTLWSWGTNNVGQLGQNDAISRSSPTQVGALTTWSKISTANNSTTAAFAIKTDGTLWAWGAGTSGQLGLNSAYSKSSPTQVGALTSWAYVASKNNATAAIRTNGTLWTWGYGGPGAAGQLGQNDAISRSSPTQVGALTNWSKVAAASGSFTAIKTDGTMWSWGSNSSGALGLNISAGTNASSPTQIGALTTWSLIGRSATTNVFATKTDGTLWAWGSNNQGQLGLNNTTALSSPVQVGALTNWGQVSSGLSFSVGIGGIVTVDPA